MTAYLLTFAEGAMAFVSPCILPMLPVFLAYLSGDQRRPSDRIVNTVLFVLGFTVTFTAMGATAYAVGNWLFDHRDSRLRLAGTLMILFGLAYLDILPLRAALTVSGKPPKGGFSSFVFGLVYALGWTPCSGAFLGSALALASARSTALSGMALLAVFSLGLGVPFIVFAVFYEELKGKLLSGLKDSAGILKKAGGTFLILVGASMVTGLYGYYLGMF